MSIRATEAVRRTRQVAGRLASSVQNARFPGIAVGDSGLFHPCFCREWFERAERRDSNPTGKKMVG